MNRGIKIAFGHQSTTMPIIPDDVKRRWETRTLEDLRVQAERERSAIAFESFRAPTGRRLGPILCIADLVQITALDSLLCFLGEQVIGDWNDLTFLELTGRAACARHLCFGWLEDEFGRRHALVLIAADPDSIRMIESLFEMSPKMSP